MAEFVIMPSGNVWGVTTSIAHSAATLDSSHPVTTSHGNMHPHGHTSETRGCGHRHPIEGRNKPTTAILDNFETGALASQEKYPKQNKD